MLCVNLSNVSLTRLIFLTFIHCIHAFDLESWNTLQIIPTSYFKISTQNILRCGKLCERQGKCAAVTFDKLERMCYMHDSDETTSLNGVEKGSRGRYLFKTVMVFREHCPIYQQPEIQSSLTEASSASTDQVPTKAPRRSERNRRPPAWLEKGDYVLSQAGGPNHETDYVFGDSTLSVASGYAMYNTEEQPLYLRFENTTKTTKHEAARACEKEYGHLIVIENEDMFNIVAEILRNRNSDSVWIDGEDVNDDGNYLNWRNKTLTYFKWGFFNPTNTSQRVSS